MEKDTLGILIPCYQETNEQIKCLLDSIKIQQNVDFDNVNVIIRGDGPDSTKINTELFNNYPFNIDYKILEKKVGVSACRNACLDASDDDYVMFCDADDMFYNVCGLWVIFSEMENGFDSLTTPFIVEFHKDGKVYYQRKDNDCVFVHGKVHRMGFLLKENIRWNPDLTIHEDSFFNIQCQSLAGENFKYIPVGFYMWKWNENSVSRKDDKYILKTFHQLLDSADALVQTFLDKDKKEIAQQQATKMIYDTYFTLNCEEWINETNKQYRDTVENRFKNFYHKYKELFENTDDNIKKIIIAGTKNRMFMEDTLFLEKITFDDWMKNFQ